MSDDADQAAPDPSHPATPEPVVDVFDGLVLDENFVRGGAYEPPHRTREAIGRHGNDSPSLRYGAPLRPVDDPSRKAKRAIRTNRKAVRSGRRELASWLPLTVAITVVVLLLAFRR